MLPWRIFESSYKVGSGVNVAFQIISTTRAVFQNTSANIFITSAKYLYRDFIRPYGMFLVIFLLIMIFKVITRSKKWILVTLIIFNLALVFAGIIIYVKYIPYLADLSDSLTRMMMFIPPMVIFLFAELISEAENA
jgi:phosphoglycerol transferase MdoB-like AlkP superfamily enzyme